MKKEFSEKFKYLGFIMTCAMVLYHCPLIENVHALSPTDYFVNSLFGDIVKSTGTLVMSYFFAVTGFLLFQNFSIKDYFSKMKRRVFSLLIPYLLWQAIIALIDIFQKQYQLTFASFLRRTFLLLAWPVNGPLWYVYAVFLLALLSPIFLLLLKRKNLGWGMILVFILFLEARGKISAAAFVKVINHGYVGNILAYLPAYLVGAFYGYHYKDGSSDSLYYLLSALILAFLMDNKLDGFFASLTIRLMPIAILYILPPVPFLQNRRIYKLSFLIYAMHQPLITDFWSPVLNFYLATIGKITMAASFGSIITSFLLLAIDIVLAASIYFLLSKISPRILSLLTGGRC